MIVNALRIIINNNLNIVIFYKIKYNNLYNLLNNKNLWMIK